MAKAAPREDWPRTVAEFEVWHARQPERWEFLSGQPRLMAPASLAHTLIKGNVYAVLRDALQGHPYQVLVDGAQILTDDISAIPDAIVTCAPLDLTTPVIAEPAIIVEVVSPSSEATIRPSSGSPTEKFLAFDTIWSCPRRSVSCWFTAAPASYGTSASSARARSNLTILRFAWRSRISMP